jgi:hypothetical protein
MNYFKNFLKIDWIKGLNIIELYIFVAVIFKNGLLAKILLKSFQN